ncbi:MAG: right-handed parallel beta-helix repeat-containing protein [Planctomycetota bacterium]
MKSWFSLLAVLIVPSLAFPATIYVPDDYTFIQSAIDASVDGDIIIVRPGTYVENIDFLGKAILVKSEQGPDVTVIDGGMKGSVVTFADNEGLDSILEGFAISNGSGTPGFGDYTFGGGIFCRNAGPTIRNNIISGNTTSTGGGDGGGIFCDAGSPWIDHNIISNNDAHWYGGGGISCHNLAAPRIESNIIHDNWADAHGGAILCDASVSPFIANNVIYANTAGMGGGIMCKWYADPLIINNTIYGNDGTMGGGIACAYWAEPTVVNSILWNNQAVYGKEIQLSYWSHNSTLTISHSDVEGGLASVNVDPNCTLNWGAGMIDGDPLFVNPAGYDLHLTYETPCKDSGDPHSLLPDEDREGDPRIAYGQVDMGADEFYTHLYCTGDATPGGHIEGKLVGLPGTDPVGLFMGIGVLDPPVATPWGSFHLEPPWLLLLLIPIPAEGVLILPAMIPPSPQAPYDLPMQALIGLEPDSLTNLFVLEVR